MNNRLGMDFFGRHQWEPRAGAPVFQVEAHLVAKYADGAGAGTVGFARTVLKNVAE